MAQWVNLLDLIYPVGSIYTIERDTGVTITNGVVENQTNTPASFFGGTWTLIGCNDNYLMYRRD
jgi:hypothetical protein